MQVTDETPARRLAIDDIAVGDAVAQNLAFDQESLDAFIDLAQDRAGHHVDDLFARTHGLAGRVVHGLLLASRFSRLLGMYLPGENAVIQSLNLNYRAPVAVGQALRYTATVTRVVPSVGAVLLDLLIGGPDSDAVFVTGTSQCVVLSAERGA